jgi:hypothetical protein
MIPPMKSAVKETGKGTRGKRVVPVRMSKGDGHLNEDE